MADTILLTNDPLTRKKWAKDLFVGLLPQTEINDLVGTGIDSIIQMKTELGKGEGDQLTFGIALPIEGEGVVGRDPVEGSEAPLTFKDFKCTIEELNQAVNTGGRMEMQRLPYNLMQIGKQALQRWWAVKLSNMAFAHLCGDTSFRVAGKIFAQAPMEPDDERWVFANDVPEADMTSADIMDLTMLDKMKQKAEVPDLSKHCYLFRPFNLKGKSYYRVILHTYVFDQLRHNTDIGQWGDLLRSAQKLAVPNVEIEYNGMLVSKSPRITQVKKDPDNPKAGVYRNLFLGAQAAVLAWGGAGESKGTTMSFVPYETDAKRFMNIRGGGIFGFQTTHFYGRDFGRMIGSAWGAPIE